MPGGGGGRLGGPSMTYKDYLNALKQVPGLVAELRRGSRQLRLTILAAASLSMGGVFASDLLPKDWREQAGRLHLPSLLIAIGVGLVIWLVVLLFRLALPLPPVGETIRPSAIKGPGSFGPQDGKLFSRLGRGDDIATLLGYVLDDQVGMVAVMGESGAGKTSLLRSGLHYQLAQRQPPVPYVYWEALPTHPMEGLLHAVGAYLEGTEGIPPSLDDLLDWADQGRGVVVLDQFEQLDPEATAHAPIFELLRRLGRRLPPYRSTWIVAFRRDYDPAWRNLELEHPALLRARMHSLKLFSREKAEAVMATLGETVELSLQGALLADMLQATGQGGCVSPVDVGIGMLILYELGQKLERRALTPDDYTVAGGAEGLLTGYIVERLSRFALPERSALLKGLLQLVDLKSNQRVAEGCTVEEMVAASGLPAGHVKACVDLLVEARLLEMVGAKSVRLLHERIIAPLRRLTGSILAERDKARLALEDGLRRWRESGGRWGLLAGAEMKLVWRNRDQLVDATREEMRFLPRSRHRQWHRRALVAAMALVAAAVLSGGVSLYQEREARHERYRTMLASRALPPDLYDQLGPLQGIRIDLFSPAMDSLEWLDGAIGLKMLDLRGTLVASLKGLPKTVTTLKLSASPSSAQMMAELPSTLRSLTLRAQRGLPSPFRVPPSLESLTLSVADGKELPDLADLPPSVRAFTVEIASLEILSPQSSRTPPVPGAAPWVYAKLGRADSLVIGDLKSSAGNPDLSGVPVSVKRLALGPRLQPPKLPPLPPTVESVALFLYFDRSTELLTSELLGRLPAKVTSMYLLSQQPSMLAPLLAKIPATLKSLALVGITSDDEIDLRRLTSLDWLYGSLDYPPHSAEASNPYPLKLPLWAGKSYVLSLPPSLRHLELDQYRIPTLRNLLPSIQSVALRLGQVDFHGLHNLPPLPHLHALDLGMASIDSLTGTPSTLSKLIMRPGQVRTLTGLPNSVKTLEFQGSDHDEDAENMLEEAFLRSRANTR